MIKCNLAVILAERNIKITELSEKTKISRVTLNHLRFNTGKGVQFETMDTLCEFLDITPGELFSHVKFNVKILDADDPLKNSETNELCVYFVCEFTDGDKTFTGRILCAWNKDEERFKIIIWNKLKNKLAKIPDIHLLQPFIDYFEKNIAKEEISVQREIALYDSEIDDWLNSEFLENIDD